MLICRCHEKRRAAERLIRRRADQLAAVTGLLVELDPSTTPRLVEGLLDEVASAAVARTALVGHLSTGPQMLTAGGSRMPKFVAEFIYAAIKAGVGLRSPGCALCGQPRTLFHTRDNAEHKGGEHKDGRHQAGERICTTCYSRSRTATCSGCGRDGQRVRSHTLAGEPLCSGCHDRAQPLEACAGCQQSRVLRVSVVDGCGYCRSCQAKRTPTEPCGLCGRDRRVNARRADGAAVCVSCYNKTRPGTPCDECGQIVPLAARAGGRSMADKNLCPRCYRHPKRDCGICGRTRRVALRATNAGPDLCPTCYQAPLVDCTVCGQRALGRRTTNNGKPWCFACQATHRIDRLLAGPEGTIPVGIKGVRDVLVATDAPRSILSNWGRTESLSLLARLARQPGELTHERLDAHGDGFSVNYLRALLVAADALPERDENVARLHLFTAQAIAEISDPQHRQLLSRYARWHVVARAKPDRHGQLSPAVADRCRQEIRHAQRFLAYLATRGSTLEDCTQAEIDNWLTQRRDYRIRFVRWLRDTKHLTGVTLPGPVPASGPRRHVDQDAHCALARRMIHDETVACLEDRAAACLVLLYAQPVSKIVALTIDDLTTTEHGTYLRLGTEPLLLIAPLDTLITSLPITKPFGTAQSLADQRWLFPGKRAGNHQHPASLMRRLNQLGITTRASRNTALLQLAATVPPAIFAGIIGISIDAATRWAEHAGSNWTTYTAPPTKNPRQ